MICWFDDVLLILIHGFAWFQVDLAFPQVSPSFIHEIPRILTPKSPFSAQNHALDLGFRVDPDPPDDRRFMDVRTTTKHRTSDHSRTTGTPNPNRIYGFPTFPDVRRPDIRPFRTSVTYRYWLRLILVSAITNSCGVRFWHSLARFEAIDIPHPKKILSTSF